VASATPTAADFLALTPYQQQAYLNGDPNFMDAGPPQPTALEQYQAETQTLAGSSDFVTIPFGTSLETVLTLDSFLSQWAAGALTFPASLGGRDPVTEALAIARDRCATIPTPDCANQAALARQYGLEVAAAIPRAPAVYAPPPAPPLTPAPAPTPAGAAPTPSPAPVSASAPAAGTAPAAAPVPAGAALPVAAAAAEPPVHATVHAAFVSGDGGGGGIGTIGSTAMSFIPLIGPILGAIFGSLFGGTDLSGLQKALDQQAKEIAQLGDTITRFAWKIANALGALFTALHDIWVGFVDALWSAVKSIWKALWCVVSTVIPKIIQILKNMRRYLDWIYDHILRPIMNYLQKVRRILQILKALHVPFADKLDRIITQIQGRIFGPFLMVLRWFNIYGSWVNTILAYDLTIQKPIFVRTMTKYQGEWINIWWNAQQGPGGAAAGQGTSAGAAERSWAGDQADFHQYVTDGSGPFAAVASEARQIFNDPTALV